MALTFSRSERTVLLGFVVAAAACSDPIESRQPESITADQTATLEGTAGAVLTTSPTFVVRDEDGASLGGVSVTVTVTAGGGTLTDAPTTSNDGPTSVGTWRLGNTAGVNSVTVTVAGVTPVVISVTGKAGPPASIVFVTGGNQSAAAGSTLPVTPVAQVRDQFGNGVSGIPVGFTVIEGDGSLAPSGPITTDASGNATAPQWTIGKSAMPQSLRANTTGNLTGVVSATVITDYSIDFRIFGPAMPPVALAMFTAAAARIRGAVVGDMVDIPFSARDLASDCGVPELPNAFSEVVDDVVIFASVGPIDGASKVLAFAFPCLVRGPFPARQTVIGVMKFDSDDLDNMIARGNLTDVIQHEMLHVVGVGTLWNSFSLIADRGTEQSRYTGTFGVGGCVAIGGASVCPGSVPLENTGGAGTADSHWRDAVFFNELMTGFVNSRASVPVGLMNPMSAMTIQSLSDVGYTVNVKAADPYTIPGTIAARVLGQLNVGEPQPAWEQLGRPRFEVTPSGRITPLLLPAPIE
jgi:hypothetical protein